MTDILAVHSFRRAAGRTNLVANLGVLLAQHGWRVAVLDLDFKSPTLHLLFGIALEGQALTLNQVLWGECPLAPACHDLGAPLGIAEPGALIFAPASPASKDIARMLRSPYRSEDLDGLLLGLAGRYELDVLLLDTAAGLNEETLAPMALCDALLVMMRPDRGDYQGTAVVLDVADSLNVPRKALALNYTPAEFDAGDLVTELQSVYGCTVAALLPYSAKLAALASGGLLALRRPSDPYLTAAGSLLTWLGV